MQKKENNSNLFLYADIQWTHLASPWKLLYLEIASQDHRSYAFVFLRTRLLGTALHFGERALPPRCTVWPVSCLFTGPRPTSHSGIPTSGLPSSSQRLLFGWRNPENSLKFYYIYVLLEEDRTVFLILDLVFSLVRQASNKFLIKRRCCHIVSYSDRLLKESY